MILAMAEDQFVLIGPLESIADGSPVTSGATLAIVTATAASPTAASGTLTHVGGGVYKYAFSLAEGATDKQQLGLVLSAAGARAVGLTVPVSRVPFDKFAGTTGGLAKHDAPTQAAVAAIEARLTEDRAARLDYLNAFITDAVASTPSLATGTARDGTADTIQLAEDTPALDLTGASVWINDGTGVGQVREIVAYDPDTQTATVGPAWRIVPDATTAYAVQDVQGTPAAPTDPPGIAYLADLIGRPYAVGQVVAVPGTAVLQLAADTPAAGAARAVVTLIDGPGAGQWQPVAMYDADTQRAYFLAAWPDAPTTETRYRLDVDARPGDSMYAGRFDAAGAPNTFQLPPNAPAVQLAGETILYVYSGAGKGQARRVATYDPATKAGTVAPDWLIPPGIGDSFTLESPARSLVAAGGLAAIKPAELAAGALAETLEGMVRQIWNEIYQRSAYNRSAGRVDRFARDGTTKLLSQPATDDGTTQTRGTAGAPQ